MLRPTLTTFVRCTVLGIWCIFSSTIQPNNLQAQDKPVFTLINVDMESYPYVMLEKSRMQISDADISDYTYLASTFKEHADPLTEKLYARLPSDLQTELESYAIGSEPDKTLKEALVRGLNMLATGPVLYEKEVFKAYYEFTEGTAPEDPMVRLPSTIQERIQEGEQGTYVNRPILDYFYGFGIEKYRSLLFEQLDKEFSNYNAMDYRAPGELEAFQLFKAQSEVAGVRDTLTYRARSVVGYDQNEIIRATADPEVIDQLRLKGADYLVFATMSTFAPSGLTGIVAKGAIVLQLTYLDVETREIYTLSVGTPSPIAMSKSLGGQGGKVDQSEIDQAYINLATEAAHGLQVSFGEDNQKAIDILTELRMLDTEIKGMKPPAGISLYLQIMAWGLTGYATASMAGVFGTGKGSPYGKANLATAIGFHGGLTWLYILYAPKLMKPFLKIKRGSLKRQYRRITGNDVPAML